MSSLKAARRWHWTFLGLLGQDPDFALWEDLARFSQLWEASHPRLGWHLAGTAMSTLGLTAVTDPGRLNLCQTQGQEQCIRSPSSSA